MSCPPAPSLPQPGSIVEAALEGGGTPPVRRYGNPDGPRLLMSHGDGLAIDLYYPSWSLLLDDFDVIVFDLRNHGANPPGDLARHTIPTFCRDLEAVGQAVDRTFGVRPRAGIYHSVSCPDPSRPAREAAGMRPVGAGVPRTERVQPALKSFPTGASCRGNR